MRRGIGGIIIPLTVIVSIAIVSTALVTFKNWAIDYAAKPATCQNCLMTLSELQALRADIKAMGRRQAGINEEFAWAYADLMGDKGLLNYIKSINGCNRCHGG